VRIVEDVTEGGSYGIKKQFPSLKGALGGMGKLLSVLLTRECLDSNTFAAKSAWIVLFHTKTNSVFLARAQKDKDLHFFVNDSSTATAKILSSSFACSAEVKMKGL